MNLIRPTRQVPGIIPPVSELVTGLSKFLQWENRGGGKTRLVRAKWF